MPSTTKMSACALSKTVRWGQNHHPVAQNFSSLNENGRWFSATFLWRGEIRPSSLVIYPSPGHRAIHCYWPVGTAPRGMPTISWNHWPIWWQEDILACNRGPGACAKRGQTYFPKNSRWGRALTLLYFMEWSKVFLLFSLWVFLTTHISVMFSLWFSVSCTFWNALDTTCDLM